MRYASKSLRKKPGFYFRRTSHRLCSSLFDIPLSEPSTALSPESGEFVVEEIFSAFAESSPFAIESPDSEEDLGPCRVSTADTLPTVNEGVPVLRFRPDELEQFPEISEEYPINSRKTSVTVSNPASILSFTYDRVHLGDLEKLYYLRNMWKSQRIKTTRMKWKKARLKGNSEIQPFHGEEIRAAYVDSVWSDDSENSIYETMVLPRIRPSKQVTGGVDDLEKITSLSAENTEEVSKEAPIEIRLPDHIYKFRIHQSFHPPPISLQEFALSRSTSLQLVKTETKLLEWDHSTAELFHNTVLKELYGQLIKRIINSHNRINLSQRFLCNMCLSGSLSFRGLLQAVSLGLKASEAVEEMQNAFVNLETVGLKYCEFARSLGECITELQCQWDFLVENDTVPDCKTQIHLNSQGYIQVQLAYVDEKDTKEEKEKASNEEMSDTSPSVSSSTSTIFPHAEDLCTAADNMLFAARGMLNTSEEEEVEKAVD